MRRRKDRTDVASSRARAVAHLELLGGLDTKAVAEKLGISPNTVKAHIHTDSAYRDEVEAITSRARDTAQEILAQAAEEASRVVVDTMRGDNIVHNRVAETRLRFDSARSILDRVGLTVQSGPIAVANAMAVAITEDEAKRCAEALESLVQEE